ncbi:MAG: right-handed parallel beta-helix repeat-containing protein, partial [Deltaproteobacteria bacterium]|nr:right-handed parallel beta-helix repeat-containing protein [Deltaproteobacteria bacterium]
HDPTIIINCMFSGNLAYSGGGAISNTWAKAKVINCTFSGNSAKGYGGGIEIGQGSSLIVTNSIFWGNIDKNGTGETSQITAWYKDLNYNCIQGWTGSFGGTGNIGSAPLFLDVDGADNVLGTEDDNARLLQGSACINAGDNSAVPPLVLTDLDGGARIANGTVDMGAYEGPDQGFLLSTEQLTVPEGGTAMFTVALAMDPLGTVEVAVTHHSGDLDITVDTGTSLTFDSSNYSETQTVTLAAAADGDYLDGVALIWVNADGFAAAGVSASEEDNEPAPAAPTVLFVDDSSPGVNAGSNWEQAYTDLQDALSIATTNSEVAEIRVAQGIYTPTEPDGYREATFQLISGVAIYGGYAGYGAPDPNERDANIYETILSGDLNGDDSQVSDPCELITEPTRAENSYHVITGSGTDTTAVLNGFTITAGNANGSSFKGNNHGGGIKGGSATLVNCTISWNSAGKSEFSSGDYGGGLKGCDGPIINCTISYNHARGRGGGLDACDGPITNCTIRGNSCENWGGGLHWCNGAITNCTISNNSAGIEGGGLHSCDGKITNCLISGNSANNGGGMYSLGNPTLTNCTFTGNYGGGMYSYFSIATLTNCILWGNEGAEVSFGDDQPVVNYSCIQGGWPGMGNIDADPQFVDLSNGNCHLKSEAGRWDANLYRSSDLVGDGIVNMVDFGEFANSWYLEGQDIAADLNRDDIVNMPDLSIFAGNFLTSGSTSGWAFDSVTSPCIDAGDPNSDWLLEFWPHGMRINMGAYGGTVEASMSLNSDGNVTDPSHPEPRNNSTGIALDGTVLSWVTGGETVYRDVYLGQSENAVENADTSSPEYKGRTVFDAFDPGSFELMKTYYWRVDQLDESGVLIVKGAVWRFSTAECVIVEDFESYDDDGNSIGDVWVDKLRWGEMQITIQNDPVISPVNSMRLRYHVPYEPFYTIAVRSFSPAQDWTVNGVEVLTIHFYGTADNFDLPMFVTVGDGTTDANIVVTDVNTTVEGWQEINVSLPEIAAAGVDLTSVSYMEIGFGDGTDLGMHGSKWDIIYIDDIALYPAE